MESTSMRNFDDGGFCCIPAKLQIVFFNKN